MTFPQSKTRTNFFVASKGSIHLTKQAEPEQKQLNPKGNMADQREDKMKPYPVAGGDPRLQGYGYTHFDIYTGYPMMNGVITDTLTELSDKLNDLLRDPAETFGCVDPAARLLEMRDKLHDIARDPRTTFWTGDLEVEIKDLRKKIRDMSRFPATNYLSDNLDYTVIKRYASLFDDGKLNETILAEQKIAFSFLD